MPDIQSAIDHIKTAIDVDPWAADMAEKALKEMERRDKTMRIDEYQTLAARTINKDLTDVEMILHALHGLSAEVDICQMNIDKLRKRYPAGFSAERSIHREE